MLKYIGIICFAALFLVSCKKEQPQMTPLNQECDCAKEVSAEFTMEEINCYNNPNSFCNFWTNTDTSFADKNIAFTALENDADYTWYIGTEILNSKQVIRYFGTNLAFSEVPITLVVKKKTNTICFPNDDGYDSIVKYLYIKSKDYDIDTTLLEGTYRMKGTHLQDSVDIILDYTRGQGTQEPAIYFDVYNYDGLGANSVKENTAIMNYRECKSYGPIWGNFKYDINNKASFEFNAYQNGNPKDYKYKGRKL